MDTQNVKTGWIYAITTRPFWFEPHIAINTSDGLFFVHAQKFDYDISKDGPHEISQELTRWVEINGQQFEEAQIFSLWSERLSADNLIEIDLDSLNWNSTVEETTSEFRKSVASNKAAEELSQWLRSSEGWQGSSSSVIYDSEGTLSGSFVTLFTSNPYKLMALLRWIGVPVEIIRNVTRVELD